MKNSKITLNYILARPANVATLVEYSKSLNFGVGDSFGAPLTHTAFIYCNGHMTEYRSMVEMSKLRKRLRTILFETPEKIPDILSDFKTHYSSVERLVKRMHSIVSRHNKGQTRQIVNLIREFSQQYFSVWPPVIFIFWLPLWIKPNELNLKQKRLLKRIIEVRNSRDKEFVFAQWFYDEVTKFVHRLLGIQIALLEICSPDELIQILNNRKIEIKLLKLLKLRQRGCVVYGGNVYSYDTPIVQRRFCDRMNILFKFQKLIKNSISVIYGQSAYKGQVYGKVRLVRSKHEMNHFKKNEILVSPMTTPYFNPIMKKVSAIITDEGGVTCHAAIVAREMKKPCIIGTKIATRVLKDGDHVEINALKGIVKKI